VFEGFPRNGLGFASRGTRLAASHGFLIQGSEKAGLDKPLKTGDEASMGGLRSASFSSARGLICPCGNGRSLDSLRWCVWRTNRGFADSEFWFGWRRR
jgi:hypothetical protein